MTEFTSFPKIPRWTKEVVITEKIDGTNASIYISLDGEFKVGSRTRWITPDNDNYGFARWVYEHEGELRRLGPGHHFGEWWGSGIQRRYGLEEKRFSLFNVSRWNEDNIPKCCSVVPLLFRGTLREGIITQIINDLAENGSAASPGFMDPEGIVIYHTASNQLYKRFIKNDEINKGRS